jgi:hypothetical protein
MSKVNNKKRKHVRVKGINIYACLFLLVVIPLILNWKNIHFDFTTIDDSAIITNNYSFLSDFSNVFKAFEEDNFISNDKGDYYRPI